MNRMCESAGRVPADPGPIDYSSMNLPAPIVRWKDAGAVRARRRMFDLFRALIPTGSATTVVDVGVTPERRLTSGNFFETHYPWKQCITATSIEDASFLEDEYPGLQFVRTDGAELPFEDQQFDVVFSSAVIEHVGNREQQRAFVHELLRVGRRFFIITPNRWFPLDFHTALPFLHWLPQPVHQAALQRLGKDFWASVDNLNLLDASSLSALVPPETHANLVRFRTAGMTSNLILHGWMGGTGLP